jgi:hypothetical protein
VQFRPALLLLACLLAAGPVAGRAEGFWQKFLDAEDGRLDLSEWLLDRKGVLPVPIVISEPAVGVGGGVAALFFRESMREAQEKAARTGRLAPPDIFALAAARTDNGTQGIAAGGMMSFDADHYRWRGGIAQPDINLQFYGIGGQGRGLAYNLKGFVSVQQGMMRLGESDWWVVARWNWLDLQNRFGAEGEAARFGPLERASRASGLGLSLEVDTRDNIFTPNRGWTGNLDATFYDPDWGSDTRFQAYRANAFAYWPLGKSVVVAGRADARAASGQVPFYMLPFVDIRGLAKARLQDERTAVLETEVRWNLDARWALVGFVGGGRAWGANTSFSEGADTFAKGVGFRYLIAKRMGLYAGVDWAWSTQDKGWYLQVGTAWR